ncbi:MAG: hypothetical protein ACRD3D_12525 [Terriglobia bacterium]
MEVLSQYENPQLISEGEPKTYRAREARTGRAVLLHQLSSNPGSGRQLRLLALVLRYTSGLRPGIPSPILGIEEESDSVWVITEDRPELANLWNWMEQQTGKKAGAAQPVVAGVTKPLAVPSAENRQPPAALDEKTVLFATRLAAADSSPLVELDTPRAGRPAEPQDGAGPEPATRFASLQDSAPQSDATQAFSRQGGEPNHATDDATVPVIPVAPARGEALEAANEPTVILQRPGLAERTAAPPAPPEPSLGAMDSPAAAGEFTMLFRRTAGSSAIDQKARFMGFTAPTQDKARFIDESPVREPLASSPDSDPFSGPSESTAMMSAPAVEPPPTHELPYFPASREDGFGGGEAEPGEFTQVFRRDQPPGDLRGPATQNQEPGAFTRIFQIPVGSDLLTEVKAEEMISPAPSAAPPAWPAEMPLDGAAEPPSLAAPPMPGMPAGIKLPGGAIPTAPPAAIPVPSAPAGIPLPGGASLAMPQAAPPPARPPALRSSAPLPQFEAPKPPPLAAPKAPALGVPKTPKLPEATGAEAGPSILPLILIFGGIVLVAVLVVLFFVTKH